MKIINLILLLLLFPTYGSAKPDNDILRYIPNFNDNAYFAESMINANDTVNILLTDEQEHYSEAWHKALNQVLTKPYPFFGGYYGYFITQNNPDDNCTEGNYCIWLVDYLHNKIIGKLPAEFKDVSHDRIITQPWSRFIEIKDRVPVNENDVKKEPEQQLRIYYFTARDDEAYYYFDYFDFDMEEESPLVALTDVIQFTKKNESQCDVKLYRDPKNLIYSAINIDTSECMVSQNYSLLGKDLGNSKNITSLVLVENDNNKLSYHIYLKDKNNKKDKYKNIMNIQSNDNYIFDFSSFNFGVLNLINSPNKLSIKWRYNDQGLTLDSQHYSAEQFPVRLNLDGSNYTAIPNS